MACGSVREPAAICVYTCVKLLASHVGRVRDSVVCHDLPAQARESDYFTAFFTSDIAVQGSAHDIGIGADDNRRLVQRHDGGLVL